MIAEKMIFEKTDVTQCGVVTVRHVFCDEKWSLTPFLFHKNRGSFVGTGFWCSTTVVKAWLCGLLALLLLGMSAAALAVTVSASPAACVSLGGGNQNWSNTDRAQSQDGSYATATVNDGQMTDPLQCTNYGFAIPADAVINGITVTDWRYASNSSCCTDAQMQLVKAGTIQTTDRSTTTYYPTSNAAEAHGSATDLWGTTWTATDINNTNFGAVFAAQKTVTAGGNRTVNVDYIQITIDYTPPPSILSINAASTNPTAPATAVAWTVMFNTSVTNVTASNFALVQAGGVSGAMITSVSGAGTTWTVNANTGSGTGTLGLNMINVAGISPAITTTMPFVGQTYDVPAPFCSPPSNTPAGVTLTCVCDTFNRATLNPSTIFGANWITSTSGGSFGAPRIITPSYLRMTDSSASVATAATAPGVFPAAGNYVSVEFSQYAYNGSGADGIAVTLSDYSVPVVPGAFGGSLGFAQKSNPGSDCTTVGGCPGFAGGWVGVALDEYGNYSSASEGRIGGPGAQSQSIGVRGPGSGQFGYRWVGGALNVGNVSINGSATPAPGNYYQVIVDARNYATGTINVSVNRDTTTKDGTNYSSLFGPFNAYTEASYALGQSWISKLVPDFWKISFTGSTGGANNTHEIGKLRICAQTIYPPSGGTASGFNAIDEAYAFPASSAQWQNYQTGHIYAKLVNTAFKLNVAALSSTGIQTGYVLSGTKNVTVKLVDNSDGVCVIDNSLVNYCNAACTGKMAVSGGSQTLGFTSTDKGQKQTANFTLTSAYKNLVAIIDDGSIKACSTDAFSVRPTSIVSVISSNATNAATTGAPVFKAGSDNFALTATITGVAGNPSGYTGTPKINSASVTAYSPATAAGTLSGNFPAATSGTPSATATGSTFIYSEVGAFNILGPNFTLTPTRIPGVYDDTWTAIDSSSLQNDCVAGTAATAYSITKNASGKYGCNFGITADTAAFGRFVPDHFDTVIVPAAGVPMICPTGLTCPALNATIPLVTGMVYSVQAFITQITARNAAGAPTVNYNGALAKNVTLSAWDALGGASNIGLGGVGSVGLLTGNTVLASAFSAGVAATGAPVYTFTITPTAPTDIFMRAQDTDNVTSLRATPSNSAEAGVKVVSGRIKVSNAYGSEKLPLTLTATAQYYTANGWVNSITDSITNLVLLPAYDVKKGAATTGTTAVTLTPVSSTLSAGNLTIRLAPPTGGATGTATITPTSPAYLPLTSGTGTFGVYSGNNNFIYQREAY